MHGSDEQQGQHPGEDETAARAQQEHPRVAVVSLLFRSRLLKQTTTALAAALQRVMSRE